ncbi:uncharacterized protein LOC111066613 [Drosophila obscura]|uniref:uncharacterized protein LOC111066613 n=1 Tax=Drosophila obscura TaxID=7282 RepID=UPI001BB2136E|nr:uncharacterized protein LOC111066613 [Drosophila obscura]XP_022211044.2 uncharacterized protein LOC111066613 [Drosophila obscura]
MDDSRRSMAANEESISMYLSFDADDTLSGGSKWQSAMVSHNSQYMEVHSSKMEANLDKTVEDREVKRAVLQDLQSEPNSPLKPFDHSLLYKHNGSSTPSKKMVAAESLPMQTPLEGENAENKENTLPDEHAAGDSTLELTGTTVKFNTLKTEDSTTDEVSMQEVAKPNILNNVYPLSENVVLENITEVSNEESSILACSPAVKETPPVADVVNEVSELLAKALKISSDVMMPSTSKLNTFETNKKRVSLLPKASGALPRPRRSNLPTAAVETRTYSFKQRMSVVVKTTLNSPSRKMGSGGGLPVSRRSVLPISKNKTGISRKSISTTGISSPKKVIPVASKPPTKIASDAVFNCNTCGVIFRVKSLHDMHVRMHDMVENGPKPLKRLNANHPIGASATASKNRCKFCDKNFALERALHIHLMQNCDKIPPAEKRKLEFTELNHVKKAQLPKIASGAGGGGGAGPSVLSAHKSQPLQITTPIGRASSYGAQNMGPPSVKKVPKNVAHAGVYRTPTKTVPCNICKQSFKSILEYTNHCMTMHSKSQTLKVAAKHEAPSAEV